MTKIRELKKEDAVLCVHDWPIKLVEWKDIKKDVKLLKKEGKVKMEKVENLIVEVKKTDFLEDLIVKKEGEVLD